MANKSFVFIALLGLAGAIDFKVGESSTKLDLGKKANVQPDRSFPVTAEGMLKADLTWSPVAFAVVDLDVSLVGFNVNDGKLYDACFYSNPKAFGSAVTHSGDDKDEDGGSERVNLKMDKIPAEVSAFVVSVFSYSGRALNTIPDAKAKIVKQDSYKLPGVVKSEFDLSARKDSATGVVLGVLVRDSATNQFTFHREDHSIFMAQHFMEPVALNVIKEVARKYVLVSTEETKLEFSMDKGEVMPFAPSTTDFAISIGWAKGEFDLDASCIMVYDDDTAVGVYYGDERSPDGAVEHTGDNQTGGEGELERILVSLTKLDPKVRHLFFLINIFKPKNVTFKDVTDAYCSIDIAGTTVKTYYLKSEDEINQKPAVVMAKASKDDSGKWSFQALGEPSEGRTWKQSKKTIERLIGDRELAWNLY